MTNLVTLTRLSNATYAVGNIDVAGSTAQVYHLPGGYIVDGDTIRDRDGAACTIDTNHVGFVRLTSPAGEKLLTTEHYHRPEGATPIRDYAALADAEDRKVRERQERDALWHQWIVVETNSGTYGDGDPQFDDYVVLEQVGTGKRRHEGPAKANAPGYARYLSGGLAKARARLADLARA